jgi:hypothetical protein
MPLQVPRAVGGGGLLPAAELIMLFGGGGLNQRLLEPSVFARPLLVQQMA